MKKGDQARVIKMIHETHYAYGGDKSGMPIGSIVTIMQIRDKRIVGKMNELRWAFHLDELELINQIPTITQAKNIIEQLPNATLLTKAQEQEITSTKLIWIQKSLEANEETKDTIIIKQHILTTDYKKINNEQTYYIKVNETIYQIDTTYQEPEIKGITQLPQPLLNIKKLKTLEELPQMPTTAIILKELIQAHLRYEELTNHNYEYQERQKNLLEELNNYNEQTKLKLKEIITTMKKEETDNIMEIATTKMINNMISYL